MHIKIMHLQLKNMIAALHPSRLGGTKKFEIQGSNFGWKALEELFLREVERAQTNQLRRVPDLKESHIHRDCWTRFNVKPAKIMQVLNADICTACFFLTVTAFVSHNIIMVNAFLFYSRSM